MGSARLEVFAHYYAAKKKIAIQKNVIEFVRMFVNLKNYKEVVMAIKVEVPKLFGYQGASIMILDEEK